MANTYWRGALLDQRTADMMTEVARLCGSGVNIRPTQGSFSGGVSASGGTHDGCGAIDLAGQDAGMTGDDRAAIRDAMRQVGFAAWVRDPSQSDWPYHVHGIAVQPGGKGDRGCLSSGAYDQIIDYFEGRNGLASNAPDDGPRQWVGVIWENYLAEGNDMPTIDEFANLFRSEGISGAGDPGFNGINKLIDNNLAQLRGEGISGSADPAHNGTREIVNAINALGASQRSVSYITALAFSVLANLVTLVILIGVVTGKITR